MTENYLTFCASRSFSSRGFSVTSVFSGEEAVERLDDAPADVILLDILLPGISGLEVLRYAKKRYPGARIIMVTGQDRVEPVVDHPLKTIGEHRVLVRFAKGIAATVTVRLSSRQ